MSVPRFHNWASAASSKKPSDASATHNRPTKAYTDKDVQVLYASLGAELVWVLESWEITYFLSLTCSIPEVLGAWDPN